MLTLDNHPTGRHFLQIPGPSPVPDRILRAMSLPTIDHRGPEFGQLGLKVLAGIQQVFKTRHPVVIYPASGTGAWEAALINTLSPGDHVLMFETGHFASLWQKMATRLGLSTEFLSYGGSDEHLPQAPGWRHGVRAGLIGARLRKDTELCLVRRQTPTSRAQPMPPGFGNATRARRVIAWRLSTNTFSRKPAGLALSRSFSSPVSSTALRSMGWRLTRSTSLCGPRVRT